MNGRKPANYGTIYRELTVSLAQNLPQMIEAYAIGKTKWRGTPQKDPLSGCVGCFQIHPR